MHNLHPKGIVVTVNRSSGEEVQQVKTGTYDAWVDQTSFPGSHTNQHVFPLPEAICSTSVNGSLGFDKDALEIHVNTIVGFVDSFQLKRGRSEGFCPDEVRKDTV